VTEDDETQNDDENDLNYTGNFNTKYLLINKHTCLNLFLISLLWCVRDIKKFISCSAMHSKHQPIKIYVISSAPVSKTYMSVADVILFPRLHMIRLCGQFICMCFI